MADVRFVLCIHNHQPTGNFDEVFEEAYQRAYRPFADVMERFPDIPWVLHNSGCLWEWLEGHHPEYLDRIGAWVAAGRVELLGGGFYEPVLPALAPEDRRGQLGRMREYLKRRFGVAPRGIWLTERVWEPDLPIDLAAEGVEYLPLDDTQLQQVGVPPEAIRAAFHTESAGRALRVFPALMTLRYRIPYAEAGETARFLSDPFPGGGGGLAVYADDGEKFGVWPGTHRLLYQEGWLERFLTALRQAGDRVRCTTLAAEMEQPSAGLVYLPTGSYAEMGQWALPPEGQAGWERARHALGAAGLRREADLFVRGGFWRNFFARYPESHWMHMRAHEASRACARAGLTGPEGDAVRDHLWRAQCNCAYWHGVFGGLYLPHLRDGIYREIIRGEARLARARRGAEGWVEARPIDLDRDGREEWVLENDASVLYLDPARGGSLVEWDDRAAAVNLVNGMTRRPEHYHRELGEAADAGPAGAETIHGRVRSREAGLRELLHYDRSTRACLLDRVFGAPPTAAELRAASGPEVAPLPEAGFDARPWSAAGVHGVRLRAGCALRLEGFPRLELEKSIALGAGWRGFELEQSYRNAGPARLRAWAGIELLVNLLAGHAPDRYAAADGRPTERPHLDALEDLEGVRRMELVDEWRGLRVGFEWDRALAVRRYPVETVSLSEAGAERVFQGTAIVLLVPLDLEAGGDDRLRLRASVGPA